MAFFFFFFLAGNLTVEEIERKCAKRKKEKCAVERERVSHINFFEFRNKYRKYEIRDNK